ncbi:MAG: uracil-DNA glycosylase [Candidatus Pacebacteria bacterium]|nr:uracil-DNA glycosylase [Candidatus Paceibacterota bacterium]
MKKVRDEVVGLTASPLYVYRKESGNLPVIGEGNHDANILFVGEAPGRNEAKTGRPFCGAAGKILDELLESIGVARESVYITNIVKDRPPENRDPSPSEIEIYGPFLDRQIEIIEPKVIAPLGRYAMGYIMEKFDLGAELEPISVAHGKLYKTGSLFGEMTISPMYHPAAAIYTRALKDTLLEDFKILKQFR